MVPALIVGLWYAATVAFALSPVVLPSPFAVFRTIFDPVTRGFLGHALVGSLGRMTVGLIAGILAGTVFGLLVGSSRLLWMIVNPWFVFTRQISVFAWIPLLTMWVGGGETAKIIIIAIAAFYPMAMNTVQGVVNVPRGFVELGRVLCLSPWRMLRRIVLPAALPSLVNGMMLAVIHAWLGTIGAEYLTGMSVGIGAYVMEARSEFRTDLVVAGVVMIGIVGMVLVRVLRDATSFGMRTTRRESLSNINEFEEVMS